MQMLTYNEMAIARHAYEDVMTVKSRPEIAPVVVEKSVITEVITALKTAFAPRARSKANLPYQHDGRGNLATQ
jgi:hypothetical protein